MLAINVIDGPDAAKTNREDNHRMAPFGCGDVGPRELVPGAVYLPG